MADPSDSPGDAMKTDSEMKSDLRARSGSNRIPRAVADGGGGTIIAGAEVSSAPERVFSALTSDVVTHRPAVDRDDETRLVICCDPVLARAAQISSNWRCSDESGSAGIERATANVDRVRHASAGCCIARNDHCAGG